jgi:putative hydrolase of the HAD superfamily
MTSKGVSSPEGSGVKPSNIESSSQTRKDKSVSLKRPIPTGFSDPRALFFDAAGTLLRLREPIGTAYARIAAQHGLDFAPDTIQAAFQTQWKQMPAQNPGIPLADDGRSWWRDLVFGTLDRLDPTPPISPGIRADLFDQLYAFYALPGTWEPYPEVRDVLTHLTRHRPFALGVISNWDGRLIRVLQGLGLTSFFDHIIVSSEVGFSKPHPAIFDLACQKSGVPPEKCVHVGDDPWADWQGAEQAGMQVFPLDRARGNLSPLIHSLAEPS